MTERQKTFARLLAADPDGNKTKAALGAGCPAKSASVTATKWLKKASIQAEIERLRARTTLKYDVSAEKVIAELAKIAFLDVRKVFHEDGSLRPLTELDDETAAAISGLEHEKLFEHFGKGQAKHVGTTSKIKLADKIRALELLGKWTKLKLFTDNVNVTGLDGLAERLNMIRNQRHGHSRPRP